MAQIRFLVRPLMREWERYGLTTIFSSPIDMINGKPYRSSCEKNVGINQWQVSQDAIHTRAMWVVIEEGTGPGNFARKEIPIGVCSKVNYKCFFNASRESLLTWEAYGGTREELPRKLFAGQAIRRHALWTINYVSLLFSCRILFPFH